MTSALIADDEPHLARYLRDQLLALWPDLDIVYLARNGVEASERIAALEPDLAFLDIEMPGLTGLEVAQGIEGGTRVVFVTAFDSYALQAFDHAALDYILKPLDPQRLARTVTRLREAAMSSAGAVPAEGAMAQALRQLATVPGKPRLRHVIAATAGRSHHIDVADVRCFHADHKYTLVDSLHGEFLIRTSIMELQSQLDPAQFRQIHRATLVNLAWLAGTRRDANSRLFVRLHGSGRELPVSRAYVHLFRAM